MTHPKAIIAVDIETLGRGSNAVVTQLAFLAAMSTDPTDTIAFDSYYLPLGPQMELGRQMSADTVLWWMEQDDKARAGFRDNYGGDFDVLAAFVRSYIRKIKQVIDSVEHYEIWARGPQFDVVILESLFESVGESAPWHYGTVRDLRTYMDAAKITKEDVDSSDIIKHIALEDCRYQMRCWAKAYEVLNTSV